MKKYFKWVIGAIAFILIIVIAIFTYHVVNENKRSSVIREVKQTTLGYSKTIENAFNDCFGKENLDWSTMHAKWDDIYTVTISDSGKTSIIDLGPLFDETERNIPISNFMMFVDYNIKTNNIENISVHTMMKSTSSETDEMNNNDWKKYTGETTEDNMWLLDGIFRENSDIAKSIEEEKEQLAIVDKIIGDIENNAISIDDAQNKIIENDILSKDFFDSHNINDKDELLRYLTTMQSILSKNAIDLEKFHKW